MMIKKNLFKTIPKMIKSQLKNRQEEDKKILSFSFFISKNLQREIIRNLIKMNPKFINYFEYY